MSRRARPADGGADTGEAARGAVLLAGGASTRMGSPKALLDWHGAPLVAHVAGVLQEAVSPGPVVVVRAPGQALPPLGDVEAVDDAIAGRGPLQGLRDGLAALAGRADLVFLAGVDTPFLHPLFVRVVLDAFDDDTDVVVPEAGGRLHPLAAGYRTRVLPVVDRLLASGERRLRAVGEHCHARVLGEPALRGHPSIAAVDPGLLALRNVNTPEEYAAALRVSGRPATG